MIQDYLVQIMCTSPVHGQFHSKKFQLMYQTEIEIPKVIRPLDVQQVHAAVEPDFRP